MNDALSEENLKKGLVLKQEEAEISPGQPWADDVLEREQIGTALTNLVSSETNPLVIGLNGAWGTGKTFVLKRWQQELEMSGYKSIYFNAWEDDFCDDPLIAIIGQLSDSLKGAKFKKIAETVKEHLKSILIENARGFLSKTTGLTISDEALEKLADQALKSYSEQRANKDRLKNELEKMSKAVKAQTRHPLIFIIDELDRCRPTFAIELLERVKHIFNIPNMVFIFGINRNELCAAVKSVYGEIDADVYIRRFFDMEFTLPKPNAEEFCKNLIVKYKLGAFFSEMSKFADHNMHRKDFNDIDLYFPLLCSHFNLSLRDIEHCMTSMIFASRNIKKQHRMFPLIVGILIILRLKNNSLYQDFIAGKCLASKVINYIDPAFEEGKVGGAKFHLLYTVRAQLYCMDVRGYVLNKPPVLQQLKLLSSGEELSHPEYLSDRIKTQGKEDKEIVNQQYAYVENLSRLHSFRLSREILPHINNLIEISSSDK